MQLSAPHLIEQLRDRIAQDAAIAARAGSDARDAAQHSATAQEKREDARTMIEFGNLAYAQAARVKKARTEAEALDMFKLQLRQKPPKPGIVGLGSIIDAISEDEEGEYARTFIMLPIGAGEELTGPNGDGAITVITPSSPIGRGMLGKQAGDVVDTTVRGEPIEWEILEVS